MITAAAARPAGDPATIKPAMFRRALGSFASGVTVVTAWSASGEPLGTTVSAFSSLSLQPPLVLVCLDRASRTLAAVRGSRRFAVNILAADQAELALRFSRGGADDRFAQIELGPHPAPLLAGCAAVLECVLEHEAEGGDHLIVIGRVSGLQVDETKPPLIYARGRFLPGAPDTA